MKNFGALLVLLAIISVASMGCGARYTKTDKSEYKINAAGKKKVVLDNITGDIKVSKSSTDEIIIIAQKEILVKKKDKDKPFDEVEIVLDTASDVVRIDSRMSERYNRQIFRKNRNMSVDYEIQVPANMELKIDNVNGNVILKDISGDVDISLINGDIDVENVSGRITTDLTNGDITGTIDSTRGLDISATNADIRLNLSDNVKAKVKAEVGNGKISYEQLNFKDIFEDKNEMFEGGNTFRGSLGDSPVEINIDIMNGKVRLYGKKQQVI